MFVGLSLRLLPQHGNAFCTSSRSNSAGNGKQIQLEEQQKSATSVRNYNKQPLNVESCTARSNTLGIQMKSFLELQKGAILAPCLQPPARTDSLLDFPHV